MRGMVRIPWTTAAALLLRCTFRPSLTFALTQRASYTTKAQTKTIMQRGGTIASTSSANIIGIRSAMEAAAAAPAAEEELQNKGIVTSESLKDPNQDVVDVLHANPAARREVVDRLNASSCPDEEKPAAQTKKMPPVAAANGPKKKVMIDLIDDSEDDDEELLALAREIEQREKARNEEEAKKRLPLKPYAQRPALVNSACGNDESEEPSKKRKTPPASLKPTAASKTCISDAAISLPSSAHYAFQVATWNVWFGSQGDGNPHAGPRMRALVRLLKEQHCTQNPLWCVGLQEVIAQTSGYLQPALEGAGYRFYRQPAAAYGCALAVHTSLEVLEQAWRPFSETAMQRGFLYARVKLPNSSDQVLFTTTHLESFSSQEFTGAKQRPEQLCEMQEFCSRQFQQHSDLKAAFLTGDMNWDDERIRSAGLDPVMSTVLSNEWKDSWLETKAGKQTCYTYDGKMNPMLGGNLRRRFDRILTRGSCVSAVSTQLLGMQAIPDLTWQRYSDWTRSTKEMPTAPSDHFGYLVTMRMD